MQRKLAAILAADVVGYSRLIAEDEARTLDALRALRRESFEPLVAEHRGEVVKRMGDGWLVAFASVVDAAACAIAVQERLAGYDRIKLRIGLHLGDIVHEDEDIYGDGVNIAARLQEVAEPGGILISGTAHESLIGRLDEKFEDAGERSLKNIRRPVRVCFWKGRASDSSQTDEPSDHKGMLAAEKPSIAVLPFDNMSGDAEQEYFADGISEDVITDLSKVSGLTVIARNSSFAYKAKSIDIRQVCRELGVLYVLEGSVRKGGNRVRINAQLIDGSDGSHVWADRFDRHLEDIFAVQDDVTRKIVEALQVALTPMEKVRRSYRRSVDPQAYDLMMRARSHIYGFTREGLRVARDQLGQAIVIDPNFAIAFAWRAIVSAVEYFNDWTDREPHPLDAGLADAEKACALDPNEPHGHYARGLVMIWRRDLDAALAAEDRAIELDPNMAGAYAARGNVLDFSGHPERAIDSLKHALRLDPGYDIALQFLGRAQFSCQRYDEAAETFRQRLQLSPRSDVTRVFLASAYGLTGRLDEALRIWAELQQINPKFEVGHLANVYPYRDENWLENLTNGLRLAGVLEVPE